MLNGGPAYSIKKIEFMNSIPNRPAYTGTMTDMNIMGHVTPMAVLNKVQELQRDIITMGSVIKGKANLEQVQELSEVVSKRTSESLECDDMEKKFDEFNTRIDSVILVQSSRIEELTSDFAYLESEVSVLKDVNAVRHEINETLTEKIRLVMSLLDSKSLDTQGASKTTICVNGSTLVEKTIYDGEVTVRINM